MTRDYFIIKVYCLVCEHYQHRLIRKVLSHTICERILIARLLAIFAEWLFHLDYIVVVRRPIG